ncbi:MAG: aminoglycoside N(3)-acetyltransferase [Alphaproteobacteria bacterium]|nr:MAG: aminoglycoside N(3)-acetyltransferase [Alphaproteobacteria bacterium]
MDRSILKRAARRAKAALRAPIDAAKRGLRRRQLSGRLQHVDRDTLVQDLEALALPDGAVLLVHSALKQLGFVEGGPASVIAALTEVVVKRRGGTLALPTFSIDGTMYKTMASGRAFDVRTTPCNLGAIPETFRRTPDVRRSVHPTHSFAALGDKADWIVRDHHRCGSNFGTDSPMARIMQAGGFLAGLGTDLGPVTFYHCLEDIEPDFPRPVYAPGAPFSIACRDWNGALHMLALRAHAPDLSQTRIDRPDSQAIRAFITRHLETHAGLEWFPIGQGRGWIVPMPAMYAACRDLMRKGITIYTTAAELDGQAPSLPAD